MGNLIIRVVFAGAILAGSFYLQERHRKVQQIRSHHNDRVLELMPAIEGVSESPEEIARKARTFRSLPIEQQVEAIKSNTYVVFEEGTPYTRWLFLRDLFPHLNAKERDEVALKYFSEFSFSATPDR